MGEYFSVGVQNNDARVSQVRCVLLFVVILYLDHLPAVCLLAVCCHMSVECDRLEWPHS